MQQDERLRSLLRHKPEEEKLMNKYDVLLIPQLTNMGCWAASIAMIYSWKQRVCIDPGIIAARSGYQKYLKDGLPPSDDKILRDWGIVPEAPQSYSIAGFLLLLQNYGPLWVAAWAPEAHVRVVTGFDADPDPAKARVWINDPWEKGMKDFRLPNTGSRYTLSYLEFTGEQESLARRELKNIGPHDPNPIYVAHLP